MYFLCLSVGYGPFMVCGTGYTWSGRRQSEKGKHGESFFNNTVIFQYYDFQYNLIIILKYFLSQILLIFPSHSRLSCIRMEHSWYGTAQRALPPSLTHSWYFTRTKSSTFRFGKLRTASCLVLALNLLRYSCTCFCKVGH